MVKIMHLAIMIVTLLVPIDSYAQFGFNGNETIERKKIIEKIKTIEPEQIKNNQTLGLELGKLARQLKATLDYTIEQLHKEQLPELDQAQEAVLLNFADPKHKLVNHAAVRTLLECLKRYTHTLTITNSNTKINS